MGKLEKSSPQSRVEKWAASQRLKVTAELQAASEVKEGDTPKPEFYIFERA